MIFPGGSSRHARVWTHSCLQSMRVRFTFFRAISAVADGKMSGFKKGVGVVGEHYIHNGTYDEHTRSFYRLGV